MNRLSVQLFGAPDDIHASILFIEHGAIGPLLSGIQKSSQAVFSCLIKQSNGAPTDVVVSV
jgi:hypothetical protein